MADEQEVVVAAGAEPAPAPEVTAIPEAVVSNEPEAKPAEPPKTFTQEELDAAISKRLAREQRKWEREQAAKAAPAPAPVQPEGEPSVTPEILTLAERIANQREQQKQVAQVVEAYHDREEAAREKYDDFDQVAYNPKLPITDAMAATIRESDVGPEIIYHLGSNPAEAKRISQLSPLSQAKEIGKLEDKLASNPPAKKVSSAPAPIRPVSGRASSAQVFDTTDPRSIQTMSTSEWIEADRVRQLKKLGHSTSR